MRTRRRFAMTRSARLGLKAAAVALSLAVASWPNMGRAAEPPQVEVIRCPETAGGLNQRWEWARQAARGRNAANGFWIGYSVEKLMEENAFIGCFFDGRRPEDVSLGALLDGKETLHPSRARNVSFFSGRMRFSDRGGRDRIVRLVKKRIGILYRFAKGADVLPESVGATDDHFPVAFGGKPLLWLGPASEEDSLRVLTALYDRSAPAALAERLVETAGIHEDPAPVIPFLERVIQSRAPEPVRIEAVSALAGYRDDRVFRILAPLAESDPSLEIRKEAVDGLGEIGKPEAVDKLIAIARSAGPAEVREKAIQALAENVSDKVLSALESIIEKDPDLEIKEEAVRALSDLEAEAGLPLLIKIARTHAVVEIRKTAIESLGDSSDPKALQALIELARNPVRRGS